jgi:hypothetical protein
VEPMQTRCMVACSHTSDALPLPVQVDMSAMMEADKPSSKKGGDAMEGSSEGEEEEDAMDDDEYGAPSTAQVQDALLLYWQLLDACWCSVTGPLDSWDWLIRCAMCAHVHIWGCSVM